VRPAPMAATISLAVSSCRAGSTLASTAHVR
jgi:hypothetical protein